MNLKLEMDDRNQEVEATLEGGAVTKYCSSSVVAGTILFLPLRSFLQANNDKGH